MLIQIQLKRKIISTWIIIFFSFSLGLAAFISDFFQAPTNTSQELNQYRLLFKQEKLFEITHLEIKNRLGQFKLAKKEISDTQNRWELVFPRTLPANQNTLNSILRVIENIKIRKVFNKDPINESNFSLDEPNISITFSFENSEDIEFKLGLTNPIDNSTYVTVSNKEAIYHVDSLSKNLETLDLSQLIDSKVFNFSKQDISKIQVMKNQYKKVREILMIKADKQGNYIDSKGRNLQLNKVQEYFNKVLTIKSNIILDQQSKKTKSLLKKYFDNPLYEMKITNTQEEEFEYYISDVINIDIPELKIEKRNYFLIFSKSLLHPYLLSANAMKFFSINTSKMRNLNIKTLFY